MITALDHLQISIPAGRLDEALAFYAGLLGFTRVAKPPELAATPGAWLTQSGFSLHLGEEENFVTDGCGHPAFCVADLDALMAKLTQAGIRVRMDAGPSGYKRGSAWDPFGSRIEFMQKL